MANETLVLFGREYETPGFKAKDDNDVTHTYEEGGGGGSNDFIITLSYNSTSEMWEPDKTFAEISAAYDAEKNIAVIVDDNQDGMVSPTYYIDVDGSGDLFTVSYYITVFSYDEQTEEDIQTVLGYVQYSDRYIFTFENVYYYPYDADAVASNVASGKIFYTSTGRAEGSAPLRTGSDLYTSSGGQTVNIPAGFYENALYYGVDFGTAGTPTATKGTVSNHAVTVTPSVTNTTGWITGSTINGTAVNVSASELVSGALNIDDDGTYDVTNYASAEVAIDYVSKTVPVTFVNHTSVVTTLQRSAFRTSIVDSDGYINNVATYLFTANSTAVVYFPSWYINFILSRSNSAQTNFEIQIGGVTKEPTDEWEHYKLYMFTSSNNPTSGWTVDIYDTADPWPVDIVAEPLSVSTNGTYTAPSGTAYTPVTVNVQSNDFIVTLSYNSTSEMWEPDCTYAELMVAYTAEKNIVFVTDDPAYALAEFDSYDTVTTNFLYFVNAYDENDNLTYYLYGIQANEHVFITDSYTYYDIYDATAVAAHVKSGDTFYASTGKVTGTATARSSTDLTASGATVTAPAGFYESAATKAVASGTEGTPTATKGAVSNHQISVTPSVTNVAGYISGGTHSGTAVTVTASELDSGTKSISQNGTNIDVVGYAAVDVNVSAPTPTLETVTKTYTPTESQQTETITPSSGYDGIGEVDVTVGAISSTYVGTGIARRTASDLYGEYDYGQYFITTPPGYYDRSYYKEVPNGTAGTPTATKGTVSNHAVSVTPSVTNTAGYITNSTKTGTAVSVSASELVSGTLSITSSGTKDVTNYASASVSAGTEGTPSATKGSVSNHSVSVTPSVTNTAGYITGGTKTGTAVSVSASELVSGSETKTANGTYDVTNLASLVVAIPFSTITTSSSNPTGGNNGDVWIKTS